MKKSRKIALCSVLAALSLGVLLCAYFPYLTYALPAVAGTLIPIALIETDKKWAFACYICTAVLAMLICEKEAAVLYALFFGCYPVFKSYFERLRLRWAEYLLKLLVFNSGVAIAYCILIFLFRIDMTEYEIGGRLIIWPLVLLANIVFVLYDLGLSRLITMYAVKYHDKLRKLLK